jgi:endoglycosylceramidase
VIGYDLLNEPFGDEVTEIGPLYEDVAKRIRKHDTKGILFIEPQVSFCLGRAVTEIPL